MIKWILIMAYFVPNGDIYLETIPFDTYQLCISALDTVRAINEGEEIEMEARCVERKYDGFN
jgi:hypothetical protein